MCIHRGTDTLGLFSLCACKQLAPLSCAELITMAMVVMATLQQRERDRQQFAATNLVYPPLHLLLSTCCLCTTGSDAVCSEHLWFCFWSHLSPQQLSHTDEHTPQPLVDGQSCAGERLPSELNNDDLMRKETYKNKVVDVNDFLITVFKKSCCP